MICVYCRREIKKGDRRYFSRQACMNGSYHWDCFVEKCREVNQEGASNVDGSLKDDKGFTAYYGGGHSVGDD
jgi:hypothetical protein